MKVFKKVNETLSYLKEKNIKIAVLSCMIKKEIQTNLSLLNFKDFEIIFSLEDYKYKRPAPNGLNMIIKKLNIKPEETMYIGDTINDIRMAKNANIISIAVKTGTQNNNLLKKENPDYLLNNFSELKQIIK